MGIRAVACLLLLTFILTGCASTYDPLRSQSATAPVETYCTASGAKKYEDGIRCAEIVRDAYSEAMVNDAVTSDRVALALIPLGAAAVGLGVSGVSGAPITGIALGGATIYGGARWLTSQERRQVFGTGAEACQCVLDAARPLKVPQGLQNGLTRAIGDLDASVVILDEERRQVLANLQAAATPPDVVKAAEDVLTEARATRERAGALQERIDGAGAAIVSAVQSVRLRVTRAAVGTAQDLRDLPDFLKSTVYGSFQDFAGLGMLGTRPGKPEGQLQTSPLDTPRTKALKEAIDNVRLKTAALSKAMELISIGDVSAEFAKCLDAVKGLKAPVRLRVLPASLVRLGPSDASTILITGGSAPYAAIPLWAESTDLKVSGPPPTGPARVEIAAGPKLSGGPYFLSIRDEQNDVEKTVRIEIVKRDGAAQPAVATPAAVSVERGDLEAIRAALNQPARPFAPWTGSRPGATWQVPDPAKGRFTLPFSSTAAAQTARSHDNTAKRIASDPAVTVTVEETDLVVTVADANVKPLAQKATLKQWP